MGNIIVLAVLAVIVIAAARSIYRSRKAGGCHCDGNCGSCKDCH